MRNLTRVSRYNWVSRCKVCGAEFRMRYRKYALILLQDHVKAEHGAA